jgi:hypothetical protein
MRINSSDINKYENWQIKFILLWVIVNSFGFGIGVVSGEIIGHWIGESAGLRAGIISATIVFEVSVWIMRQSVLRNVQGFKLWSKIDSIILFTSEMMGMLIAEGFYEVTKAESMTIGPLWGSIIGAGVLITLWFIRMPKSTKWKRRFQAFLFGIIAMFGGSFFLGAVFVFSQETGRYFQKMLGQLLGMGITGLLIGVLLGLITGIAYLRMKVVRFYDPYSLENLEHI